MCQAWSPVHYDRQQTKHTHTVIHSINVCCSRISHQCSGCEYWTIRLTGVESVHVQQLEFNIRFHSLNNHDVHATKETDCNAASFATLSCQGSTLDAPCTKAFHALVRFGSTCHEAPHRADPTTSQRKGGLHEDPVRAWARSRCRSWVTRPCHVTNKSFTSTAKKVSKRSAIEDLPETGKQRSTSQMYRLSLDDPSSYILVPRSGTQDLQITIQ